MHELSTPLSTVMNSPGRVQRVTALMLWMPFSILGFSYMVSGCLGADAASDIPQNNSRGFTWSLRDAADER
jgi:hypothetical protein